MILIKKVSARCEISPKKIWLAGSMGLITKHGHQKTPFSLLRSTPHQLEGCGSLCFLTFWGKITKKLCVHSYFFCGEISKKFCVPSNFYMGEIMKKLCVPSNLFLGEIRQKLNCVPSFPCLC